MVVVYFSTCVKLNEFIFFDQVLITATCFTTLTHSPGFCRQVTQAASSPPKSQAWVEGLGSSCPLYSICPVPAPTSQIVRLCEEMSQPKKSFSEVNAPCSAGHGQRTLRLCPLHAFNTAVQGCNARES